MKFYGELLVFVLLLITNLRVFFVRHVRRDPLVSLAPFTLIVSILQIFSWGVDFFTALALILSFLVLLSNFHAIFRYSERLYVDHYSPLMKIWAAFTIFLSVASIIFIILFAPIQLDNTKNDVKETQVRYKGNFRTGFEECSAVSSTDAVFYMFEPLDKDGVYTPSKGIILFIPDKRGDTFNYKPYLQLLAKDGYTVCSADFYADDGKWLHSFEDNKIFRRISLVIRSLYNNTQFMGQREFYSYNISQECSALKKMMNEQFGSWCNYYLICDVMGNTAIEDFARNNADVVNGTFHLDTIKEYQTAGYGCIEQTDPLLAKFLGLERDSSLYTPNLLVIKTNKQLKELEK